MSQNVTSSDGRSETAHGIFNNRYLPYGNVIFYKGMEEHRQVCRDFLNGKDIYGIGRFGEWDYLWSDQSYLSGKRTADKLIDLMSV